MAKIYVASSWRNENLQQFISLLREHNHLVYDFTKPHGEFKKNVWDEINLLHDSCTNQEFKDTMSNPVVQARYLEHLAAMAAADTCILLLPCGFSAHCEAGFIAGMSKRVIVFNSNDKVRPELMYLMFENFTDNIDELLRLLEVPQPGICRICGCDENNRCYNHKYGYCSWADETRTICTHCANKEIADDPETTHCSNDITKAFR